MEDILKFEDNEFEEKDWDTFGKGLDLSEQEKEEGEANARMRATQARLMPKTETVTTIK